MGSGQVPKYLGHVLLMADEGYFYQANADPACHNLPGVALALLRCGMTCCSFVRAVFEEMVGRRRVSLIQVKYMLWHVKNDVERVPGKAGQPLAKNPSYGPVAWTVACSKEAGANPRWQVTDC